jgi:glycosyltransferase involved in cell wall biosynthesis
MVTTFYPPYHFGGDATYVYRLTNDLARRGHHVDVICDHDAYYLAHPAEPTTQFEQHPNVTVHALKSRFGFLSPLATQQTGQPWFKPQVRELLETNVYDVIHYHNISLIGPGALAYGHGLKLQTLHEHWLICPMHVLWKFDRAPCVRRQCLLCTLHGRRPPQWWRYTGLLKQQLAHVDQLIAPSRFTRRKHLDGGIDQSIVVLPYFLPRANDPEPGSQPPHGRPYFLFVGRLVKIKGLQTLIPVFRQYPQADLVVAGEGNYRQELRTLAASVPNIHFVGAQSHARLREYYRHAIAVIMPSVCYEVFGIVLIEAFAMKTPVIVRDLGGMPEAVEDSGGGFVYRDDADLVKGMMRLQADPALRQSLGENGYAAYERLWSEEAHMKQYFEIIAAAQARKRGEFSPSDWRCAKSTDIQVGEAG